ncbi:hypothetical protein FQA39_LY14892 [Lamprigera yunnana]|nr:hypothetical protein FQA39_LY14892 [Lamprigera yunnana]
MSGYKRVNFYELCRLCATNQQKEKTHIFQEEGRKIQLQNKIQSCLSLKVCENDFLPKVVCSQCLRTLEECCVFRKECYSSETMLSSYFNNFRYTDDFKKSGKVYIKDTTPKTTVPQTSTESSASTNPYITVSPATNNGQEAIPYYTVNLPQTSEPKVFKDPKVISQPQIIYNLNAIKTTTPKINNSNNVTVNSNGELITISSLVDVDALVPVIQKSSRKVQKKTKEEIIKIDLTHKSKPKINRCCSNGTPRLNQPNANRSQKFLNFNNLNINTNLCATNNINSVHISNINAQDEVPNIETSLVNVGYNTNQYAKQEVHMDIAPDLYVNQNCALLRNGGQFSNQNFSYPTIQPSPAVDQIPKQDNGKRHTCEICCKTFKRREHLYQHMKLHTGFRPFTCENCNKSFLRKEHLLRHMVAHSGQKNFTCTICEKSFSRNDNLLKHKKIHNKQSSFTCEVCQKQFVMEHYYFAHKRTHDNEKCINQPWGLLKGL